jgi:integrase
MVDISKLPVVTEPAEEYLNPRQLLDYRNERERCLTWLLSLGKNPEAGEGYAVGTVKPRSYRMDQLYRWAWEFEDGYTANIQPEHGDEWLRNLAQADYSSAHKTNCQKAAQMLFKWRHHECGSAEWDPAIRFSESSSTQPRDFLTRREREQIRDAALEYGSVPSYSNLTPAERDRWKVYLSQRFEKPKNEISPSDWTRANGWKTPSLVWASLDAGLRPIEVGRATTSWVDAANSLLRIPKQQSAKSRDNWTVSIKNQTADFLKRWLNERETYPKYDETDALWLTREGNPFSSQSLKYILEQLCDSAGIETETRQLSWYAIRHSVGTYMTREEDLAAAQAQLRHKSPETTMKYDQAPVEDRRDALDRMG